MSKNLTQALPGGALLPFMSAQRLNQLAWTVFESLGGFQKLEHVAGKNDENYKWFIEKVLVKSTPKTMNLESASGGIEALLDKAKKAKDDGLLDITPTEVTDAD